MARLIPRLDIKGPNLVKGIHLEGLRVLGKPEFFARRYYEEGRLGDIRCEEGIALVKWFDGEWPERFAQQIFQYLGTPCRGIPCRASYVHRTDDD